MAAAAANGEKPKAGIKNQRQSGSGVKENRGAAASIGGVAAMAAAKQHQRNQRRNVKSISVK